MGIGISLPAVGLGDGGFAASAVSSTVALGGSGQAAQIADVQALFGSLGLGSTTDLSG